MQLYAFFIDWVSLNLSAIGWKYTKLTFQKKMHSYNIERYKKFNDDVLLSNW